MAPFVASVNKPSVQTLGQKCLVAITHDPDISKCIDISWQVILFQYIPEINIKIIGIYRKYYFKDNLWASFIFPKEIIIPEMNSNKSIISTQSFTLEIPDDLILGRYYLQCEANYNTGFESNSFKFSQEIRFIRKT
jgi:hypothetical protein